MSETNSGLAEEIKIVSLLDKELMGNLDFPTYYLCPETGQYKPFNSRILTLVSEIRSALNFEPIEYPTYQPQLERLKGEEMAKAAGKELKAEWPDSDLPITVLQAILGGKIHHTLIDDTPGGHHTCMKIILGTIEMFRKAGGCTDVFTIIRASSAGAEIAYKGDELCTTDTATFLFHAPSTATQNQNTNEAYRRKFHERFVKAKDCTAKERILAEIARKSPRVEFEVTGKDLHDLGLVTKLFDDKSGLIKHLIGTSGWQYDPIEKRRIDEYLRRWYIFDACYWINLEGEAKEAFKAFLER